METKKIKIESVELPIEKLIAFAIFLGWQQKVIVHEPQEDGTIKVIEKENPHTYSDFLIYKYSEPIIADITRLNIAELQKQSDEKIRQAQAQAHSLAKEAITGSVE